MLGSVVVAALFGLQSSVLRSERSSASVRVVRGKGYGALWWRTRWRTQLKGSRHSGQPVTALPTKVFAARTVAGTKQTNRQTERQRRLTQCAGLADGVCQQQQQQGSVTNSIRQWARNRLEGVLLQLLQKVSVLFLSREFGRKKC